MTAKLKKWATQLPNNPVTRFAPSPGGWLHLGHVLSAMYVWGFGRSIDAKIILRIEDHDLPRARPEFEQGIYDDLSWLGLEADEAPYALSTPSLHRQSNHLSDYAHAIDLLWSKGLVYACDCTRKQIAERTKQEGDELFYDGFCRGRRLPRDGDVGLRLVTQSNTTSFHDGLQGWQNQNPAQQCGDWLLRDRNGNFTYNAAVTIDDLRDQINLVVRGSDLLHATGRQLQLRQLLGSHTNPLFLHHPLIMDGPNKLSKREGALGIKELRKQGKSAADIWLLAAHAGQLPAIKNLADAVSYFKSLLG
jgi:glutamyl-tRNA synthetase/glutamyl-Q tRNA(Asp) synthetase